jgi:hypothetical protein
MTDYRQICYNTLSADAYWQVNKSIAKMFDNDTAILLADLLSKERYFYEKDELTVGGYFFNTGANIEEDTNITVKKQRIIIETIEKAGLISTILMGIPAKKHFKINHQAIIEVMQVMQVKQNLPNKYSQNGETCIAKNAKLYNKSNKNKGNKNKDNNTLKEKNIKKEKFQTFWKQYPRKVAKAVAEKSFLKLNPNDELFEKMLEALEQHKLSTQWLNHNCKYIPHASTWLNQKRWEDILEVENRITSLDDVAF